jgi:hypothetical protein
MSNRSSSYTPTTSSISLLPFHSKVMTNVAFRYLGKALRELDSRVKSTLLQFEGRHKVSRRQASFTLLMTLI